MFRHQTGLTLIEIMITLALLAIVLMIGVPSFQGFTETSRARALTNDLTSALQLARSEAIKTRSEMRVCPSVDQQTCSVTVDWSSGWILLDTTNNTLIRVWQAPSGANTLTGPNNGVRFRSNGMSSSETFNLVVGRCTREIETGTTGRINFGELDCS
ncbi:GspH/FimT family pseudopilin [Nitrincola alkalisediminis]|uniref:GspH/FimT family pseudopilin n=1 Tax=Nitrincola alkalisediminis TaxID=1366656 RepID=UPI001875F4E1|nr:GspH/FimT family pseudopilin [Nitrincola alkalisediminis]